MFQIAQYETFQNGQVIFEENSYGDWMYVVEEGAVEISKKINKKKVIVEVLQPGEIFGELAYIAKIPRTATATAIGETVVGVIDRNIFDREFNQLRSDFQMVLRTIALRLKKMTEATLEDKFHAAPPASPEKGK